MKSRSVPLRSVVVRHRHRAFSSALGTRCIISRQTISSSPPRWFQIAGSTIPSRFLTTNSGQSRILVEKSKLANEPGTKATVILNNPDKLNYLDKDAVSELTNVFEKDLREDRSIRAVVITGQSSTTKTASFCAGANINEMAEIASTEDAEAFIGTVHRMCQAVYTSPAVTIARIDGLCFGAGLELVACCDFRYGTERSQFSMREVAVGIPSVVQARLLANIMGWQKAKRLVLLGLIEKASKMHKEGLLDECFADAKDMDQYINEEIKLLGSYSQAAIESQKRLNRYWEEHDQAAGIERGIYEFGRMFDDGGESVKQVMGQFFKRSRK